MQVYPACKATLIILVTPKIQVIRLFNIMVVVGEGGWSRCRNYLYGESWYTSYVGATNSKKESHGQAVM